MGLVYLKGATTLAFDPSLCAGCGICLDVCPHGVFRRNGGLVEIADRDACMECGACARNCAAGAITVAAGVGCAAALIAARVSGSDAPCCG